MNNNNVENHEELFTSYRRDMLESIPAVNNPEVMAWLLESERSIREYGGYQDGVETVKESMWEVPSCVTKRSEEWVKLEEYLSDYLFYFYP